MARIDNLFDSGRGRLGNLVFYKVGDKSYVRTRAGHFSDRKSPAQLAQRQRVQAVNTFLGAFRELIRITFAGEAEGRSPRAAALSYNLRHALAGEYPDIHVDKSKALLSRGFLPLPAAAWVEPHPEGLLVKWENGTEDTGSAARDTLVVMALSELDGRSDYKFTEVQRTAGEYLWKTALKVSEANRPGVWIAFRNRQETQLSDSMYAEGRQ